MNVQRASLSRRHRRHVSLEISTSHGQSMHHTKQNQNSNRKHELAHPNERNKKKQALNKFAKVVNDLQTAYRSLFMLANWEKTPLLN